MCQLSLVNLGNPKLNQIFLSTLLQVDSTGNADGTGFLSVNEKHYDIWKTKEAADNIGNLGMALRKMITGKYPVMAHVRAASKGIVVTNENAHPFDGERFCLAHNGRLYGKDEQVSWSYVSDDAGLESDSLKFLAALDKTAKDFPDTSVPEMLVATMSDYKGKFALLIYDKVGDKHYIARGKTADLHIVRIYEGSEDDKVQVGFIINTRKNSLLDALTISSQICQIVSESHLSYSTVDELEAESIFEVEGCDIKKVGDIKEGNVVYYTPPTTYGQWAGTADPANLNLPIWKQSDRLNKFMNDHFLNIFDIDALLYIFLGVAMADVTITDLDTFIIDVIPRISAPKAVREQIKAILPAEGRIYPIIYQSIKGLEYPWMLNTPSMLETMIKQLSATIRKMLS